MVEQYGTWLVCVFGCVAHSMLHMTLLCEYLCISDPSWLCVCVCLLAV